MIFLCYACFLWKFIILEPLLIPISLLAYGFPNTMHRFTLDLEELILPRVCWNPDSFSEPPGTSRVSGAAPPSYIFILISGFPPLLTLLCHISLLYSLPSLLFIPSRMTFPWPTCPSGVSSTSASWGDLHWPLHLQRKLSLQSPFCGPPASLLRST